MHVHVHTNLHNYLHIIRFTYTIILQSTSVLVCTVHVLALYVCTISIVLWYMLCDGFTYFSQAVGVTSDLPDRVPYSFYYNDVGPPYSVSSSEWIYKGSEILHNGRSTYVHVLSHLLSLSRGDTVGLLITSTGSLHVYIGGRHVACVATGLPVNKPMWGVADVYGRCSKIKSEMLSGKLDGVSV